MALVPVIGGAPRSGTTLLRLMLDSHPDLAIPPETGFLLLMAERTAAGVAPVDAAGFLGEITRFPADAPNWSDFGVDVEDVAARMSCPYSVADGLRSFFCTYAAAFGKDRWGDKTPANSREFLGITKLLPEAAPIHLVRNGRAVAQSLATMWFSPGTDLAVRVRHWRDWVIRARSQAAQCPRSLEVRYEDLVAQPENTLRGVCDFLDLSFDPSMLRHHLRADSRLAEHGDRYRTDGSLLVSRAQRAAMQRWSRGPLQVSRVDAWKDGWTQADEQIFQSVAGDVAAELGYGKI